MRVSHLFLAVTLLGLSACRPPAQEAGPLSDEDVAAIKELVSLRAALAQAPNWDAWWAVYERDALFVPPYGAPYAIADWMSAYDSSEINVAEFSAEIEEIDGRGDLAYLRARYLEVMSMTEGAEPQPLTGTYVWLLRKKPDGSWRVFMAMWNAADPEEWPRDP